MTKTECKDCFEGKVTIESVNPSHYAKEPLWKTHDCVECGGTGFIELEEV